MLMNEREVTVVREDERNEEKIGKHLRVIQWEFSTATLRSWAMLLATILKRLEIAIDKTKDARKMNLTVKETEGFQDIHRWCYCLYMCVHWKEGVIKTLLTKTSLAHSFNLGDVVPNSMGGTQIQCFSFLHPGLMKYPQKRR